MLVASLFLSVTLANEETRSPFQPMTIGKESGRGRKGEESHEFTLDVPGKIEPTTQLQWERMKERKAKDSGEGRNDTRALFFDSFPNTTQLESTKVGNKAVN